MRVQQQEQPGQRDDVREQRDGGADRTAESHGADRREQCHEAESKEQDLAAVAHTTPPSARAVAPRLCDEMPRLPASTNSSRNFCKKPSIGMAVPSANAQMVLPIMLFAMS